MTDHLDRRKEKRKGWFKKKGNKPIKDYNTSCKNGNRGYQGPRSEAHHIIPQKSIDTSAAETPQSWRYIQDVMYITPWNINHADNMVGLPTAHSYMQFYQGAARLSAKGMRLRYKALVVWFNKWSLPTRRRWLEDFGSHSPENHPLHNPVYFGHTEYNDDVKDKLLEQVWNELDEAKKNHEADAKSVKEQLEELAKKRYNYLIKRGKGATQANWDKAHSDPNAMAAVEPFTMADVGENPIFG